MTVAELIGYLKTQDQSALVITVGYGGGYCDVGGGNERFMNLNVNTAWYYGPHNEIESGGVKALVL
jgi:hypothetical protein